MRQILTVEVKGRIQPHDIRAAWHELERLRGEDPESNLLWVGNYRDLLTQGETALWVELEPLEEEVIATMRLREES